MGEHRLKGWTRRVLRKVFGLNETLKKVHSEEIRDFPFSIMMINWKNDYIIKAY
jgi:hypothetical protein